jgi:hypothetical protein
LKINSPAFGFLSAVVNYAREENEMSNNKQIKRNKPELIRTAKAAFQHPRLASQATPSEAEIWQSLAAAGAGGRTELMAENANSGRFFGMSGAF